MDRAVPNLPSRDFAATARFYGAFGFASVFRDDGWLILSRGSIELEFFPFPELDPADSSFMCSVRVGDLDALWRDIAATDVPRAGIGIPRLTEIAPQTWGLRAAFLVDPDGTLLHLIEDPRMRSADRAAGS